MHGKALAAPRDSATPQPGRTIKIGGAYRGKRGTTV